MYQYTSEAEEVQRRGGGDGAQEEQQQQQQQKKKKDERRFNKKEKKMINAEWMAPNGKSAAPVEKAKKEKSRWLYSLHAIVVVRNRIATAPLTRSVEREEP